METVDLRANKVLQTAISQQALKIEREGDGARVMTDVEIVLKNEVW